MAVAAVAEAKAPDHQGLEWALLSLKGTPVVGGGEKK
jgi:hypothetical protein